MIKAGVLDVTEYPTFDAEDGHGILNMDDDAEEEFEIDINDVRSPPPPPQSLFTPASCVPAAKLNLSQLRGCGE